MTGIQGFQVDIGLNDLNDVSITGGSPAQDGHVLTFSGGSPQGFVLSAPAGGTGLFTEDASDNIVGGTGAGASFTTAQWNFLGGRDAGTDITDGFGNTIIGYQAGVSITGNDNNTIIGSFACGDPAHAVGSNNTVVGSGQAGRAINNTGALGNTFIGHAVAANATGGLCLNNTVVGSSAMSSLQGGDENVVMGNLAGTGLTNGSNNVIIGKSAGTSITTTSYNTFVGNATGAQATGYGNVFLGSGAGPTSGGGLANLNNKLYIHNSENNQPLIGGDFSAGYVTINGDLQVLGHIVGNEPEVQNGYGGGYAIDWTQGNFQNIIFDYAYGGPPATVTITFTQPPAGPTQLVLRTQDFGDASISTINWPTQVLWPGGTEPTWTDAPGSPPTTGFDVIQFYFDGTNYNAISVALNMQ